MCRIGKSQIKAIALIDTGATGGNFINAVNAQRVTNIEGFTLGVAIVVVLFTCIVRCHGHAEQVMRI